MSQTPALFLIHGWPNAGRVWVPLIASLRELGFDGPIVAPDIPGFGGRKPRVGAYRCDPVAVDLVADFKQRQIFRPWVLIGHSMGGKLAQLIAARKPAGLQRLVLIAPAPLVASPTSEERKSAQREAFNDSVRLRALINDMRAVPLPDGVLDGLVMMARMCDRAAFDGWINTMRDEDFTDRLDRILVPTLVVHGEKDPLRSEELLRRDVVDRIKYASLVVQPDVGHMVHDEAPDALAKTILDWLGDAGTIPDLLDDAGTIPDLLDDAGTIPDLLDDAGTIPDLLDDAGTIPDLLDDAGTIPDLLDDAGTIPDLLDDAGTIPDLLDDAE